MGHAYQSCEDELYCVAWDGFDGVWGESDGVVSADNNLYVFGVNGSEQLAEPHEDNFRKKHFCAMNLLWKVMNDVDEKRRCEATRDINRGFSAAKDGWNSEFDLIKPWSP